MIDNQGEKIIGDIILTQPISYYSFSLFLAAVTLSGILFLVSNDYSRKQSVTGLLVPDNGIVDVYPSQSGILFELKVNEGEQVKLNSELFKLKIEQSSTESFYTTDQILQELDAQETLLKNTMLFEEQYLHDFLIQHDVSILNIDNEIHQLEVLRRLQEELVTLENQAYRRAESLLNRRMIAQSNLEDIQKNYLESEIQLRNLDLTITQKQAELQKSQIDRETFIINSRREISEIENSLSELNKQKANTYANRTSVIHAPVTGHITSLVSEPGQRVTPNTIVLSIIPAKSILEAHLYIPTRAIGFIEVGQAVNIKYEAFPYERFGIYNGVVKNISNSVLTQNELPVDLHLDQPAYKVTVLLDQQTVVAYGEDFSLKPGMLLAADVELDKRSLLEWLLEPLYSLRGVI